MCSNRWLDGAIQPPPHDVLRRLQKRAQDHRHWLEEKTTAADSVETRVLLDVLADSCLVSEEMTEIPDPEIDPKILQDLMIVLQQEHEDLQLLKLHLFSEQLLAMTIGNYLRTTEAALQKNLRLGYAQKVAFVELSHLIPKEGCDLLRKLNALRQKVAHQLRYTLTDEDRDSLTKGLGKKADDGVKGNVFRRLAPFLGGYLSGGVRLSRMAAERLGGVESSGNQASS